MENQTIIVVGELDKAGKTRGRIGSAFTKGWNKAAPVGNTGGSKFREGATVVAETAAQGAGIIASTVVNGVRGIFSNK